MNKTNIRSVLEEFIPHKNVNFEEYQDKFYLKKRIQEAIPGKTDAVIYKAIDFANEFVKPPRMRTDYINVLIKKLDAASN
jgi:hypothetical protein